MGLRPNLYQRAPDRPEHGFSYLCQCCRSRTETTEQIGCPSCTKHARPYRPFLPESSQALVPERFAQQVRLRAVQSAIAMRDRYLCLLLTSDLHRNPLKQPSGVLEL